uniref:CSON004388 protein n=1 Tax=Culicoides sonorensis TaxID=179676 RepID=A0A336KAU8_CULSO
MFGFTAIIKVFKMMLLAQGPGLGPSVLSSSVVEFESNSFSSDDIKVVVETQEAKKEQFRLGSEGPLIAVAPIFLSVVTNNLVTDSNKISISSSNNSTNNNNKVSSTIHQEKEKLNHTKQETNFEDYDNEWDVGIGDLIIDLDADIEKSTQQNSQSSSSSSASNNSSSNLQTPLPKSGNLGTKVTNKNNNNNNNTNKPRETTNQSDPLAIPKTLINLKSAAANSVNIAGKDQKKISGSSANTVNSTSAGTTVATNKSIKVSVNETGSSGTKLGTSTTTTKHNYHHSHHHHHHKSDTSSSSSIKSETLSSSTLSTSEKMSSIGGTSGNNKTAGKLTATASAVDHQATLDKGLKMKIKRTKPGTKTSEAKHEIVKAEQNGAASGLDSDTNSSSGGSSNGKKQQQQNTLPVPAVGSLVVPVTPNSVGTTTTPQSNKRGSSSHRRDKQKDKKEKSDHNSTNPSNITTSTSSPTTCNCPSETVAVNGVASLTCSSSVCKNRNDSLSMRLSGNMGLNASVTNNFTGSSITGAGSTKEKITSVGSNVPQQLSGNTSNLSSTTSMSNTNNTNISTSANNLKSNTNTLISATSNNNVLPSGRDIAFNTNNSNNKNLAQANSLSSSFTRETSDDKSGASTGRCGSPPLKRVKCDPTDMVDACVGTSVGTITEPDCLGPCEPGTSVTLEGIVWHETEGGVLVVNVTWRGKTYVGTLLDCTRHDWAPPRLCDSPTEDLDSRTPKGRETRSSVNSKLRNGGNKGRGGRTSTTGSNTSTTNSNSSSSNSNSSSSTTVTNSSNTPSPSPNTGAFLPPRPEKRKSKDESPSPVNGNVTGGTGSSATGQNASGATTQSVVNPVTGQNVQISTKKCKTASPCAVSPVLLECPEQDCSKKYKHANGLRYHQSHAHGSISSMDEDSSQLPESPQRLNPPSTPSSPGLDKAITSSSNNFTTNTSSPPLTVTSQNNTTNLSTPQTPTKPPDLVTTSTQGSTQAPGIPQSTSSPVSNNASVVDGGTTGASVVGGSITTGVAGQPTNILPPPPNDTKPLGSPLRPGDLTLKAKSSILRYHHGSEIPSQHSIDAIASSHNNSGNGALNLIERPSGLSMQQQQQPQQLISQHHHSNTHGSSVGSLSVLSASLNAAPMQMRPITGLLGPTSGQIAANQAHITDLSVQNPALLKGPSGFTKPNNKKNRKSPTPGDFDNSTNRDDVQSPAYSDISDDSTPQIIDGEEKSKHAPANSECASIVGKKSAESPGGPGPIGSLRGYEMFQMYPPYYPPGHPEAGKAIPIPQSPSSGRDLKDPNNAPPLDLINKPLAQQPNSDSNGNPQPLISNIAKDSLQNNIPPQQTQLPGMPPGKLPPHYYPIGYPLSYPFMQDPAYGPMSMMSDADKMRAMAAAEASNIKEERNKDSSSPNDHPKSGTQQSLQGKIIKSEPLSLKDIKTEAGHSGPPMHPMFRHNLGPSPHLSREEDFRRYYSPYSPSQRRSSHPSGPPTNLSTSKEDISPGSSSHMSSMGPSPSSSGPPPPTGAQSLQSMQQASKNLKSSMLNQSPQQKPSNLSSKDSSSSGGKQSGPSSSEDKDPPKVKQEGQKPTMETQGPPPPPTSQFYLHPSFASPYPFEPIYRNMLVSAPYNAPAYHLPMARIPPPEDLSRNPNTKALDLLQHHANQYYNSHKIHELSEHGINVNDRSLKSPTSNVKVSVSSPSLTPQGGPPSSNSTERPIPPSPNHPASNLGPSPGPPNMSNPQPQSKNLDKSMNESPSGKGDVPLGPDMKDNGGRSPPPQRHVHTHHHTHVGLGYPMYPAPYGAAAVLASQQAAAVAVINPYPPPPTK